MTCLLRVLVTLSLALTTTNAFAQAPDTVLLNGKIVTADEGGTVHQALALRAGRIVALGRSAAIKRLAGKQTRVVDADGPFAKFEERRWPQSEPISPIRSKLPRIVAAT